MAQVNKYQKGKIYKIWRNDCPEVYVGSTIQTLSQRLRGHRSHYKGFLAGTEGGCSSYQVLATPGYQITLLELFPCNSIDELKAREQHWIDQTPDCVNKYAAYSN